MMYVMWAIFKSLNYVDLWLVFLNLAYGMFYIAIRRNANRKIDLPLMHQINLGFRVKQYN
jgi:hypothetical protein